MSCHVDICNGHRNGDDDDDDGDDDGDGADGCHLSRGLLGLWSLVEPAGFSPSSPPWEPEVLPTKNHGSGGRGRGDTHIL